MRNILGGILISVAVAYAWASYFHLQSSEMSRLRAPCVFLPHGGGPWPFMARNGLSAEEERHLRRYLEHDLPAAVAHSPVPATALLVVSAHWEEHLPTVQAAAAPSLFYDYSGFPPETYKLSWAAKGAPALAKRVSQLVGGREDPDRGYDHGTFVPLMLGFKDGAIPVLQLSLLAGLDPRAHVALGAKLAPLRDEGVVIVGSGMSFHNMGAFFGQGGAAVRFAAREFDAWLRAAATDPDHAARTAALAAWESAPGARLCHPREEHLIPLLVVAGAAGADSGRVAYSDTQYGFDVLAVHYGDAAGEPVLHDSPRIDPQ